MPPQLTSQVSEIGSEMELEEVAKVLRALSFHLLGLVFHKTNEWWLSVSFLRAPYDKSIWHEEYLRMLQRRIRHKQLCRTSRAWTGSTDPDITDFCMPVMLYLCGFLTLGGTTASLGSLCLFGMVCHQTNQLHSPVECRHQVLQRGFCCSNAIDQGCPVLLLESQCPVEFSANLIQHTCLEVWFIVAIQEQDWTTLL